jgi:hypothetical protein
VSATDAVIAALVLAAAGWLLYRSLWRARGPCGGCSGGGCGRDRAAPEGLVKLRGAPRR